MAKRVIVIASGETERRALPLLVSHLRDRGISVVDVRIPPRHRRLDTQMAERLIRASWYESLDALPAKFVILVDSDGKATGDTLAPFRDSLPRRLGDEIGGRVLYATARWHLEAWYFADNVNLRRYLGRPLGSVDTSRPDEIQNPKLHLKNLLGDRVYTARVSAEIAGELNPSYMAQHSPSFQAFLKSVINGVSANRSQLANISKGAF